jgi:hypothetical protein
MLMVAFSHSPFLEVKMAVSKVATSSGKSSLATWLLKVS